MPTTRPDAAPTMSTRSLFTDAGGVGLNLQHAAAVVVNMDLPWNPPGLTARRPMPMRVLAK